MNLTEFSLKQFHLPTFSHFKCSMLDTHTLTASGPIPHPESPFDLNS